MFQNEYHMNVALYRKFTCPPMTKIRGFWIWVAVLVLALAGYAVMARYGLRRSFQNGVLLLALAAAYRAFFFHPMYANKQYQMLCNNLGKHEWDSRILVGDTVQVYEDNELCSDVPWEHVTGLVEAKSYFDLGAEGDFIRLAKDGFTKGDPAGFLAWMREKHPEIPYKEEIPQFNR